MYSERQKTGTITQLSLPFKQLCHLVLLNRALLRCSFISLAAFTPFVAVMTRATFGCKVCGDFKKVALGRWTSHQPHIIVMLSALAHFHGLEVKDLKEIYRSFQIRRMVCREHYVDAVRISLVSLGFIELYE